MSINDFLLKIRRRESPYYDKLYLLLKRVRAVNVPVIRPLHNLLYAEYRLRRTFWRGFWRLFYFEPIFKSQCESVGKGLNLTGGMPLIQGNLHIVFGDNVSLHGKSTFNGAKVFERPTLRVGNNTVLGYQLQITVGCDVTIGNNVLIGGGVSIFSYDQHRSNPAERNLPPLSASSRPIVIEDNVWIAEKCLIMKGVVIGKNSIIASGSVVTQKVPPDSLAIGNPARVFPLMY
jgi:acetyltransferase-like isoleucine patch superfamily enzyme